jgi:hypothetical protein
LPASAAAGQSHREAHVPPAGRTLSREMIMSAVAYRTNVRKIEERRRAVRSRKTGKKLPDGRDEFEVEYEQIGHGMTLEDQREWLIFPDPLPFQVGDAVEVIIRKIET